MHQNKEIWLICIENVRRDSEATLGENLVSISHFLPSANRSGESLWSTENGAAL